MKIFAWITAFILWTVHPFLLYIAIFIAFVYAVTSVFVPTILPATLRSAVGVAEGFIEPQSEDQQSTMMNVRIAENKCSKCGHEWRDLAGQRALAYQAGCPQCGSLYWKWLDYKQE